MIFQLYCMYIFKNKEIFYTYHFIRCHEGLEIIRTKLLDICCEVVFWLNELELSLKGSISLSKSSVFLFFYLVDLLFILNFIS